MKWIASKEIDIRMPYLKGGQLFIEVRSFSPKRYKKAVFTLACYFKKEFGYDFTQYGWDGNERDPNHHAYLFMYPDSVDDGFSAPVIGGCCFRRGGNDL